MKTIEETKHWILETYDGDRGPFKTDVEAVTYLENKSQVWWAKKPLKLVEVIMIKTVHHEYKEGFQI
jgi:hypothetical protein